MVASFTDDFSVTWQDDSLAAEHWRMDRIHFPEAQPPLTQDFFRLIVELAFDARVVFVNGYAFLNRFGIVPAPPEVKGRGAAAIWREDYVHRVRDFCLEARRRDYDSLATPALAEAVEALLEDAARTFRYTVTVILGFMTPGLELAAFCERELGAEGPALAATLLQGFENDSAAPGQALSDLADLASRSPALAAALRRGLYEDLASAPGGIEFLDHFRSFLDEHGWRAEGWTHTHRPTWNEDPSIPLGLISRYLADPLHAPTASMRRAAEQREAAARTVEGGLSGEKREQFRALFLAARDHTLISEERARWQLTLVACPRPAILALGRKLAASGAIDQPDDVFYLRLPELQDLARRPSPRHELVAERKAELAHWTQLTPPDAIGGPPTAAPAYPGQANFQRYFLGLGAADIEGQVIKGLAASRGTVRGRARVVLDLQQAGALEPGDILVCQTTSPPWTPLFAIAAAVVTDSGGILTHSAICAREYGIPCVVGTRYATTRIPNGATITVDGTQGTVTIEA